MNFEKAIELYKEVIKIKPDMTQAYFNIGYTNQHIGEIEEAIKYFKKTIEINPNFHKAYKILGEIYLEKKQYKVALKYLKKAVKLNHKDFASHLRLMSILIELSEFSLAEEYLKSILKTFPHKKELVYNIGYSLKLQGKADEAGKYYQKALAIDPHFDEAHLGLSKSYLSKGQFKNGWKHFEYRFYKKKYSQALNYQHLRPQDLVNKTVLLLAVGTR